MRLLWQLAQAPRQPGFAFRDERTIERAQRRRVSAMVHYAYRYVPFYRDAIDRAGLVPADLRSGSDLARLPLIERSDLQRDPELFVSTARPFERYARLQTGGSTGMPVTVYHDQLALIRAAVYHQR